MTSDPDPTKAQASKRTKRERKPDPVDALPFVGIGDDGERRWAPASTGDNIQDYLPGLKYVDDALDCALSEEGSCSNLLSFIIMDMLRSFGIDIVNEKNMEIAFLVRLAAFAKEGAWFSKAWKELPPGQSLRFTKPYAEADAAA
jgi:hypothetical protein